MKIRKFNESINVDMESHTVICRDNDKHITQQIISKEIIKDYFSLVEEFCKVDEPELFVLDKEKNQKNDVSPNSLKYDRSGNAQISYDVILFVDIDEDFYVDHGNSSEAYYRYSDMIIYSKVINALNSINSKLQYHNHAMYVSPQDNNITCTIVNNSNNI